jgi:hypothetical protein
LHTIVAALVVPRVSTPQKKILSSSKAHFTHLLQENPAGSTNPGFDRLPGDSEQFGSLDA